MGRKIPGKKHKGVKDPLLQNVKRLKELQNKINRPPEDPDKQEISNKLRQLMKVTEDNRNNVSLRRKKRIKKKKKNSGLLNSANMLEKEVTLPGMTRPQKPIPIFAQREGETDKTFLWRISKICKNVIKETNFEETFGVDINRNPETGEVIEVNKKEKDVLLDVIADNTHKGKKPKISKAEKRKKRVLEKKEKKREKKSLKLEKHQDDFHHLRDDVKFGEIVHAPPNLKASLKKTNSKDTEGRPGKKDLLLKTLLPTEKKPVVIFPRITKNMDRTCKRKDLPAAERRQLERERNQVVMAYRVMKAQKAKQGLLG